MTTALVTKKMRLRALAGATCPPRHAPTAIRSFSTTFERGNEFAVIYTAYMQLCSVPDRTGVLKLIRIAETIQVKHAYSGHAARELHEVPLCL
jgi:hypothetical protein